MLILGQLDVPIWVLLVVFLIVTFIIYATWDFNVFKSQGVPGPRPWPIVGTALPLFAQGMIKHDSDVMKKYGKVVGTFTGSLPTLMVADMEMLRDIYVKEFASFTNRRTFKMGDKNIDSMITNLQDDHWKHARSNMTPAFTTGKLRQMVSEINRCASQLKVNIDKQVEEGNQVDVKELYGGFTMDVIASTAFGIRVDSQRDKNNMFVTKAKKSFTMTASNPVLIIIFFFPIMRPILRALGISFFRKDVKDFFMGVARKAMKLRKEEHDQSRSDFLQLMINAKKGETIVDEEDKAEGVGHSKQGLTTPEIMGNAFLFMVAGYETTATALTHLMYHLALNQDCQEKLSREILKVIGEKETIDYKLVSQMPYLDQCICESLRIQPPAVRTNRICNRDITLKGIHIKKGMEVVIPIYTIHHDPEIWPEPEKYDPDRFAPEKRATMDPYHWMPFGNGPRNCIGMRLALTEIKVAACHVLKGYRVVTCEKTQIPLKFTGLNFPKAEQGVWLKFEKRVEE